MQFQMYTRFTAKDFVQGQNQRPKAIFLNKFL